ncbi:MAG TPA: hypothetical protein VNA04_09975 [Thermoanaerobaculia bacterium]|nr:hypothetical protein [Thermoanaerobaculia bacterium]
MHVLTWDLNTGAATADIVVSDHWVQTSPNGCVVDYRSSKGAQWSGNVGPCQTCPVLAELSVTAFPAGMLQLAGAAGATDRFVIANLAGVASDVTLVNDGDFFTQTPTSFLLHPGESRVVRITALPRPEGVHEGASVLSATNFPAQLRIPIKLLVAAAPAGEPDVVVSRLAIDVIDIPGVNEEGSVDLTNHGTGTARGLLVSDAEWLIPQSGVITIDPQQTVGVSFVIDDAKRPRLELDAYALVGAVRFVYLKGSGDALRAHGTGSASTGQTQTSVNSSTYPVPLASPIPPSGKPVVVVPGLTKTPGLSTRLSMIGGRPGGFGPIKLYYLPLGTALSGAWSVGLSGLPAGIPLSIPDSLKLFGFDSGSGSLHVQGGEVTELAVSVRVQKVDDPRGTVGHTMPVGRSDRGAAQGVTVVLTGLQTATGTRSTIYLQEVAGSPLSARLEFVDRRGSTITSHRESLPAFGLVQLTDPVPAEAVAARITPEDNSLGRLYAVALLIDEASGDVTPLPDWRQVYGAAQAEEMIVPFISGKSDAVGSSRTMLFITNRGQSALTGELRYVGPLTARRRAVSFGAHDSDLRSMSASSERSRTFALAAGETMTIEDATRFFGAAVGAVGYLRIATSDQGDVAVAARLATTPSGSSRRLGTAIPVIPPSSALRLGNKRFFASIEDAGADSVTQRVGGTFRTSLGMVEISGSEVTVRATLRFAYSFSGLTSVRGEVSKVYTLAPSELLFIPELAKEIIGQGRSELRDLHDLQLEIEVTGGTGSIVPYLLSTDNGSGDSVMRYE